MRLLHHRLFGEHLLEVERVLAFVDHIYARGELDDGRAEKARGTRHRTEHKLVVLLFACVWMRQRCCVDSGNEWIYAHMRIY